MKPIIFSLTVMLAFTSCHNPSENHNSEILDPQARRKQSEAILQAHKIPISSDSTDLLPDSQNNMPLREKKEVFDRANVLCYIGMTGEGVSKLSLEQTAEHRHLMDLLTPKEREYASTPQPSQEQNTAANWKYEDLHVLLWSLGVVESLDYPNQASQGGNDLMSLNDLQDPARQEKMKMRSKGEILDKADLVLRLSKACADAKAKGQPAPGGLDYDVVREWRHALCWLIHYQDKDWDALDKTNS